MNTDTATCACALLCRNQTFLLARRSLETSFYPGVWDLPGGHVRAGEIIEAALVREVEEELGVVPGSYRLIETLVEKDLEKNGPGIYAIFLVSRWSGGEPKLANIEHTELRWCSLTEAAKLQLADQRYLAIFEQIMRRPDWDQSSASTNPLISLT